MAAHPRSASSGNNAPSAPTSARIDVWLWSVRQIKSRSAATSAWQGGACTHQRRDRQARPARLGGR